MNKIIFKTIVIIIACIIVAGITYLIDKYIPEIYSLWAISTIFIGIIGGDYLDDKADDMFGY